MDHIKQYEVRAQPQLPSIATTIASGIAFLYFVYKLLEYLDYPVLAPKELIWNAIVYITPQQLLLDRARRQELRATGMLSQTHAAKGEALRRMLGMGGSAVLQRLPSEGIMRRTSSISTRFQPTPAQHLSDAPPGLGNWDNSCYQNSVLQGLASLDSLKSFLGKAENMQQSGEASMTGSLLEAISKLNDPQNNGKQLWTPAKLKSMSSWQQQDAQEYFSKIMDDLDKEATRSTAQLANKPGLEAVVVKEASDRGEDGKDMGNADGSQESTWRLNNPLDGMVAQRVTCTRCGFSDGISMIPFNCLTVPLGPNYTYDLTECLNEYTKLEEIPEVECGKCTLLRAEQQLEKMLPSPPTVRCADGEPLVDAKTLSLPPELRAQAFQRLRAIQQALEADDYEEKTLNETCSIPKRARVSSTKTKQAVVGRAPRSLAIHVNRSVFNEMTGVQSKNYASLTFPKTLDLTPWVLRAESEQDESLDQRQTHQPTADDELLSQPLVYKIKAVVTHYGRHENGHYICYRQHPIRPRKDHVIDDDDKAYDDVGEVSAPVQGPELKWWRLSDEDVSPVAEAEVLGQNGVFMLFYERGEDLMPRKSPVKNEQPIESTSATTPAHEDSHSTAVNTPANATASEPPEAVESAPAPATSQVSEPPSPTRSETEASTDFDAGSPHTAASTVPTTDDELYVDVLTKPLEGDSNQQRSTLEAGPASSLPFMRTARSGQPRSSDHTYEKREGFGEGPGGGFRAVAAT